MVEYVEEALAEVTATWSRQLDYRPSSASSASAPQPMLKDAQAQKTREVMGSEGSMAKLSTRVDRLDQPLVQIKAQLADNAKPTNSAEEEVARHAISETVAILDGPMHLFDEGTLQQPHCFWYTLCGVRFGEHTNVELRKVDSAREVEKPWCKRCMLSRRFQQMAK